MGGNNATDAGKRTVNGISRTYILVMLTLAYVVNFLDRNILGILLPSIKAEFHLSDASLGLLSGTSFALLYATLGIPLAWLADRTNRRNVIAFSMMLFSLMTALAGFATNFLQLVAARVGTGIGEAGTSPPANSVISDLYEPKERAAALSFYAAGLNVGQLTAFFAGGWIAQEFGWRLAFLAAGIPGLVLSLLILFTVPEPKRGHVEALDDEDGMSALMETVRFLMKQRAFRYIAFGAAMSAFCAYSVQGFMPLYLARNHHLDSAQIGITLALLFGVVGGIGTYGAGVLADRFSRNDIRWKLYVIIIGICCAVPFYPVYLLSSSLPLVLAAAIIPTLNVNVYLAPNYAIVQGLVPLRMRSQAAALMLFVLNIIGFGLGPLTTGAISDALKPSLGENALRWAMLSVVSTLFVATWCYWKASRALAPGAKS